jgi:hypothetical protein
VNVAIVVGRLSSLPRMSELGSGDVLVRYEVTVPRDDGPADSVPVSWVGPAKQAPPVDLARGEEVVVVGRVRRRWYKPAAGSSRSSTEVLAATVTPCRRQAAVRRAIDRALATVSEHVSS